MAFNILITKKGRINWHELHDRCQQLDRKFVTIYPIQKNYILDESGIGLSINLKNDYGLFLDDLEVLINSLTKDGFQVVELYNGDIIALGQIDKLKRLLAG